jgi:gliding motility-associated-like protein
VSRIYRCIFSCQPAVVLIFVIFFIYAPAWVRSQSTWSTTNCPQSRKEATRWYFGEKAGIDFQTDPPVSLTDQNVMNAVKATSSICDSMGNFLFFTDGNKVWDRTMTLMDNATNLLGDQAVTQPCIIVPWPGDSALYYLFTIDIIDVGSTTNYKSQGLFLTIIDMKERGGLGNALSTVLNKEILKPVTQKLTAVKHRNGRDYWVIAHQWNSRDFHAWHISPTGMAPAVVSSVGSNHGVDADINNAIGYMKASPDGSKLALAIMQDKLIELLDFNNETGQVTNPRSYTTKVPGINPYGIEFSPDSKQLYATLVEYGGTGNPTRPSYLLQFDLKSGLGNPVVIDSLRGIRNAAIQLAPDGRIYISRTGGLFPNLRLDSLEVIYNPNRPGAFCNFNHLDGTDGVGFPLQGRKSIYSLPNFVQSFVNIPTFTWDSVCQGNETRFRITNRANCQTVQWDFGDGATSSDFQPVHRFASPGQYWVKLTEYYQGNAFVDSMLVTNYKLPEISLADTVLLYTGSSINLHAGGGFMEYIWSTTSRDSIITVSGEGDYWVRVKDNHCCINSDTTFVKVFAYSIPNAFTPNGDGLNDIFSVKGLYRNIDFSMVIFDRWGRQVFESKNIDTGWNGTFGNQKCEPDSYVWIVTIKFRGEDIITQGDVKFKGTVTLVQ